MKCVAVTKEFFFSLCIIESPHRDLLLLESALTLSLYMPVVEVMSTDTSPLIRYAYLSDMSIP